MILFVSGRTDIPAYYSKWLFHRFDEGFVDTRNPFNRNLVSRIYFSDVDAILFCSKRIHPLLEYLPKIKNRYPRIEFVFHLTITPYHADIEPLMAKYKSEMIDDLRLLSFKYGKERIFLRYDPILLNSRYTIDYHRAAFRRLMELCGAEVGYVVTSFIDIYKNTRRNMGLLRLIPFKSEDYQAIGEYFSEVAHAYGTKIFTCAEKNDLTAFGFDSGACLDAEYAKNVLGISENLSKQTFRKGHNCQCVKMADIGDYNCCPSKCLYCYANYDADSIGKSVCNHDDNSSLLLGRLSPTDKVIRRKK